MSEDTGQVSQPQQRSVKVTAYGDTMAGIEMAALDQAREFFGDGWRLRVEPDYAACPVPSWGRADIAAAAGKRYMASVTVCLVEPEP
jgi:hypothetical protein